MRLPRSAVKVHQSCIMMHNQLSAEMQQKQFCMALEQAGHISAVRLHEDAEYERQVLVDVSCKHVGPLHDVACGDHGLAFASKLEMYLGPCRAN